MNNQSLLCPICKIESTPEVIKKHFSDNPDLPFHLQAFCRHCGSYIKNLPQHAVPVFHFGKHKGSTIADVGRVDKAYLEWMIQRKGKGRDAAGGTSLLTARLGVTLGKD